MIGKINYWLGFPDNIRATHIHIFFTFIPLFSAWFFLFFKPFSKYFFVCLFSDFPIFSCKFFVPSNSALKPFWGSSTYHTDNFFIQQQQCLGVVEHQNLGWDKTHTAGIIYLISVRNRLYLSKKEKSQP